ncbi:MAG: FeoA family protein [Gammaproteobacteria bacterium]|jgi:ferrous iron transport protein A
MTLSDLPAFAPAKVVEVLDSVSADHISRRLRELGFVKGEPVKVVGRGVFGGDPLLVQIGFTRFALRRSEAARITVERL